MRLNIAICDDERAQAEYVMSSVRQWADARGHICEIITFSSAEGFLFEYSENKSFDILLLDVEMGRMNGIQLAKRLRDSGCEAQIIFVTGYPEFISDGYDVAALHYLLKPLNREKLGQVLDRAVSNLEKAPRTITFSSGKELLRLRADAIRYGESDGHYVLLHTTEGEHRLRMTVPELAEHLGDGFVRPNRSFVVGLHFVVKVTKTAVELDGGKEIPLAKGSYDVINLALIKYLREH